MKINGIIRYAGDGTPLPGARIRLYIGEDELADIPSDDKGEFVFSGQASYIGDILACEVEKEQYLPKKVTHKIEQDEVRLEIKLDKPVPKEIEVRFSIKNKKGNPLQGVAVILEMGTSQVNVGVSDEDGLFKINLSPGLEGKALNYKAKLAGYVSVKGQVLLEKDISCQITMTRKSRFDKVWLWVGGLVAVEAMISGLILGDRSYFVNNIAIVPVATFALALIRPVYWKYAVLHVALLQAIASFGCILGGGYRYLDEVGFLLALSLAFIGNAILCGITSLLRQRQLKKRLEQSDT
jgi:hypothetical protein